jgi:hypothetical protein
VQERSRARIMLSDTRAPFADLRGLFEGVTDLEDAPVIMVSPDDLQANRQTAL